MKKIFMFIVILTTLIIGGLYLYTFKIKSSTEVDETWQTYENTKGGYKLSYPLGWKAYLDEHGPLREATATSHSIFLRNDDLTQTGCLPNPGIINITPVEDIQWATDHLADLDYLKMRPASLTLGKISSLAGIEATVSRLTYEPPCITNLYHRNYIFEVPGTTQGLLIKITDTTTRDFFNTFTQIFSTFEFVENN